MASYFISDAEILERLCGGEDSFLERKSFGDWKKDAVKTCVAFANSCPFEGTPGLLCIGVKDDGTIENSKDDLDTLQKTLERELEETYPPIAHHIRIVSAPKGKFVAVLVPGSSKGPHFAGPAYVRTGSKVTKASEDQFQRVIDQRDLKVREILKYRGKTVKLVRIWAMPNNLVGRKAGEADVVVVDCDSLVVKLKTTGLVQPTFMSFPLDHVVLGHDPHTNSLTIEVPQD